MSSQSSHVTALQGKARGVRIAQFFSFYKPYRLLFTLDLCCAVAAAAISLILPLWVRRIIQKLLAGIPEPAGDRMHPLVYWGLFMLALIVVQCCCELFRDMMGHVMGARMERDMRNRLFTHYQSLSFSFFDREGIGSVISRISHDLLSLAELCHHGPEDMIIYFAGSAGALVILFRINPSLALVVCAFLPVMVLYSVFFSGKLNRAYTRSREAIADLNGRIGDSIAGIRTVKSFCNEGLEAEKFREANEEFYSCRASVYRHEAWYYTILSGFITQIVTAAVVIFGGLLASGGFTGAGLDLADLVSFLLYVNYLTAPLPQLARIMAQYQEGLSGFNRFMDILALAPEEPAGPAPEASRQAALQLPGRVRGRIEFSGVSFRYEGDRNYVLKDVSFTLEGGEYAALSGPSGIGKTTLCSLIPRFYKATAGIIRLDGIDINAVPLKELRRQIGIVQQDCYIFTGTIRENIAYGKPGASIEEIAEAARKAGAHDFIMAQPQSYDTPIGQRGYTLSGGQRQRLCIARVFLKDPPVLIFDEATSALDLETEKLIQESLRDLSKNRTTLVIAHRPSTLEQADRVLILGEEGIREDPI
jgi:ATP-binding cassette subfamily B protein